MPLIVKRIEIKAVDSIKYLRVMLDTHLTDDVHVRQIKKKATKIVTGLASIIKSI